MSMYDDLNSTVSRRRMLQRCSNGFGAMALASMLNHTAIASPDSLPVGAALKATHHAPKAKHVIFCYMSGGVSAIDSFDPKPFLNRDHGKPMPVKTIRMA